MVHVKEYICNFQVSAYIRNGFEITFHARPLCRQENLRPILPERSVEPAWQWRSFEATFTKLCFARRKVSRHTWRQQYMPCADPIRAELESRSFSVRHPAIRVCDPLKHGIQGHVQKERGGHRRLTFIHIYHEDVCLWKIPIP